MQEARSVYVDASWCENNSGVLQYPIPDGIEVSGNDLVAYCDDFSVAGVVSSINPSTNRLYLLERSPKGFFFASPAGDKVWARAQMSDIGEELTFSQCRRIPTLSSMTLRCTRICQAPSKTETVELLFANQTIRPRPWLVICSTKS